MGLGSWQRFRELVVAGERKAKYVQHWTQLRAMLELPSDAMLVRLRESVAAMDEITFGYFCETIALVANKSWQHAGLVGISDEHEFSRRWDAYFSSDDPQAALLDRLLKLRAQLDLLRKPIAQAPLSDAEQALFTIGSALGDRLMTASAGAAPGAASTAVVDGLIALIGDYRTVLANTPLENRMRRMLLDGLESALEAAGRSCFLLNRFAEAKLWYDSASTAYTERGEFANAQRCRTLSGAIRVSSSGDVDEAVRSSLATLIEDETHGTPASLDGVKAAIGLLKASVQAGDLFEAGNLVCKTLLMLEQRGCADPATAGIEAAFGTWVDALPAQLEGTDVFAWLSSVIEIYSALAGARATLAHGHDTAAEQNAHTVLFGMRDYSSRMFAESMAAEAELERMWVAMSDCPLGLDPGLMATLHELNAATDRVQQRIFALGQEIGTLSDEIDRREAAGISLEDLLAQAEQAGKEADTLGQPAYAALAEINRADVLLELQRPREALELLSIARAAWAHAFAASTGGDAQQRSLDVRFLVRVIRAHAEIGDMPSIFACAGEAIEIVERDRYQVSSPYMQSAFLKERAELYMFGVFSAYKLGDYTTMLERAELAKARAALRLRYLPEPPVHELADLEAQFRVISAQMDAASTPELAAQRRQIWDLMTIARMRGAADGAVAPVFALLALQATLATTDVVFYYYWLDDNVLLVTAIDAATVIVERVVINDAERANFNDLVEGLATLLHDNENLDAAIQSCSALCLPAPIAAFLEGKKRLIISPHRALHLFPFHALLWNNARLIEHVAVSYTPSLGMLLVPPTTAPEPRVLLMGVSDFSGIAGESLMPLPGVDTELQAVADVYRADTVALDVLANADATRTALLALNDSGALQRYSRIVLATHGTSVFTPDAVNAPMESRVYLHDSALDGLEISRLRIKADLVVMSACCSGQRAIAGRGMNALPGDDLFGLQAAFNMAGTREMLACLWPAYDTVTPGIMQAFHRRLQDGIPSDIALQRALIDHLRGGVRLQPFYWAPFFLSSMGPLSRTSQKDMA